VTEIIGIDHLYIAVSDLPRSETFYDQVMLETLAFRKSRFNLNSEPHIQYFNRQFGFVLRPARTLAKDNGGFPGLHHLCFRVASPADVESVAARLEALGINATAARLYPEYAADYWATFFEDPDGIRLEVTNFRQERRERHDNWDQLP
jgi:catechol 2,3-dioxygenase-like lactoylglutathione lyase family enzyme